MQLRPMRQLLVEEVQQRYLGETMDSLCMQGVLVLYQLRLQVGQGAHRSRFYSQQQQDYAAEKGALKPM